MSTNISSTGINSTMKESSPRKSPRSAAKQANSTSFNANTVIGTKELSNNNTPVAAVAVANPSSSVEISSGKARMLLIERSLDTFAMKLSSNTKSANLATAPGTKRQRSVIPQLQLSKLSSNPDTSTARKDQYLTSVSARTIESKEDRMKSLMLPLSSIPKASIILDDENDHASESSYIPVPEPPMSARDELSKTVITRIDKSDFQTSVSKKSQEEFAELSELMNRAPLCNQKGNATIDVGRMKLGDKHVQYLAKGFIKIHSESSKILNIILR
jgi:hypothetical protein